MDKNDEQIMVVDKDLLFENGASFEGFRSKSEVNFYDRMLQHRINMKRGLAEENTQYKQPIPYLFIISPSMRVFAYQRSKKAGESRLHDKWSWGIGGHINEADTKTEDPIKTALLRELEEEVTGVNNHSFTLLGYINDESSEVSKVHFALLYAVRTDSEDVRFRDQEIRRGSLHDLAGIGRLCSNGCDIENWSRIALDPLKLYLKSQNIQNLKRLTPSELSEHKVYD